MFPIPKREGMVFKTVLVIRMSWNLVFKEGAIWSPEVLLSYKARFRRNGDVIKTVFAAWKREIASDKLGMRVDASAAAIAGQRHSSSQQHPTSVNGYSQISADVFHWGSLWRFAVETEIALEMTRCDLHSYSAKLIVMIVIKEIVVASHLSIKYPHTMKRKKIIYEPTGSLRISFLKFFNVEFQYWNIQKNILTRTSSHKTFTYKNFLKKYSLI